MSKKEQTFEQTISRIDEIVKMLEKGDAKLEESLTLFEEGVKLIETCNKMLENAEQKVSELQANLGEQTTGESNHPKEYLFDDE